MLRQQGPGYRGLALKALAGVAAIAIGTAAVAYAATSPGHGQTGRPGLQGDRPLGSVSLRPAGPVILAHPPAVATSSTASFRFSGGGRGSSLQCRIDDAAWAACRSPSAFTKIAAGRHVFRVRAVIGRRLRSASTVFTWLRVEPKRFSVELRYPRLGSLYPGAAPISLPLTLHNPNPISIVVTRLRVAVDRDPAGCRSGENLELIQSNASPSRSLAISAGGSARVPVGALTAPAIRMRDLAVNQDACQNVHFPLRFTGSAHG